MGRLTALAARALSRPGRHSDGLYLHVTPAGSKSWVQRIVIDGRCRDVGLGPYPAVSLARARCIAHDNRTAVAEGRDPVAEKRQAREAAARVIGLRRPTWSNPKHAAQWQSTLQTCAFPLIGHKAVDAITAADVMEALTPIWTSKAETASRVRQRMETVMDWAVAQGYRLDNPAGRSLLKVLPKTQRLKEHHRALPYAQVPGAVRQVRESTAGRPTKLAFEFLVLTACRSGEVRAAGWTEVDWEPATWEIPASRMKARHTHRVPLSGRAIEILREASRLGDWAGPGLPRCPKRQRGVSHDLHCPAPAARNPRRTPWISDFLQKLGCRVHRHWTPAAPGRWIGSPQRRQQHRGSIHAERPIRPEAGADGPVGGIHYRRDRYGGEQ